MGNRPRTAGSVCGARSSDSGSPTTRDVSCDGLQALPPRPAPRRDCERDCERDCDREHDSTTAIATLRPRVRPRLRHCDREYDRDCDIATATASTSATAGLGVDHLAGSWHCRFMVQLESL